jgi:hypothetical protein
MTNSVAEGLTFLYSTLTGDSTFMGYVTGVYRGIAPEGSTADYAILIPQTATKVLTAFGVKIMTSSLYQVKMVGPEADMANLSAAWDRAVVLLGLVRNGADNVLACYLQQDLYIQEVVSGIQWANLGGLFRMEFS